jgi:endo-1,4-beta-xylanase
MKTYLSYPVGFIPRVVSCLLALSAFVCSVASAGDLEDAIYKNRKGTLVIEAAAGTEVKVEQVRHEFWFGAALANQAFGPGLSAEDKARYRGIFLSNFNAGVTENALKWHMMEPRRGRVDYSVVDGILAWTEENGIPLRGHNIFWGIPNRVPDWQKDLNDAELKEVLEQRARDVGRRYRGRFAEYDLNNEMMHADYYQERLGPGVPVEMARWMKTEDPEAVLFLNDYDVLTGKRLEEFVEHVRKLQGMGVPVGGLGVQGHSHGDTFDRETLKKSLDRLAEFRLPIRVTEFNLPGQHSRYYGERGVRLSAGEEEENAQAVTDFLTICFAHPAVDGVLFWGFWEGANWIPVSSLYRRDWSPTPSAEAYRSLVFGKWWSKSVGRTDSEGRLEVSVFYGRHRVSAGGKATVVDVKRSKGTTTIRLDD